LLADELNRSSPKTQSALLECMQEKNISVNRVTMKLPEPFFLIATQNPISYEGTYKIPESQLDRFTIKIKLDYPSEEREKEIFSKALINPLENFEDNILTIEDIKKIQKISESVHISDKIIKFVQDIVNQSRCHEDIMAGISTRGGILWIRLAKSIALLAGRNFLIPDDLIDIAHECLAHRMLFNEDNYERVLNKLFESVNI
ncbi:MAG: hypothetical protein CMP11_01100, partial [Zetaproteobacteria bacterium]|nr:hypothetical protein [Pseudobdellovibrionaceae bacterium]